MNWFEHNLWLATWIEAIATFAAVVAAVIGARIAYNQWRSGEQFQTESLLPVIVARPTEEAGRSERDTWITITNHGKTSASNLSLTMSVEVLRYEGVAWKSGIEDLKLPYDYLAPQQSVTARWLFTEPFNPIEGQDLKVRILHLQVGYTDTRDTAHVWQGEITEDLGAH